MKALTVAEAITSRMSVRAFTKESVSKELILKLLDISARAPSGTDHHPDRRSHHQPVEHRQRDHAQQSRHRQYRGADYRASSRHCKLANCRYEQRQRGRFDNVASFRIRCGRARCTRFLAAQCFCFGTDCRFEHYAVSQSQLCPGRRFKRHQCVRAHVQSGHCL